METAVLVQGISEIGSVGGMLALVMFQIIAGGEGEAFDGIGFGVEGDVCEFGAIEGVGGSISRNMVASLWR